MKNNWTPATIKSYLESIKKICDHLEKSIEDPMFHYAIGTSNATIADCLLAFMFFAFVHPTHGALSDGVKKGIDEMFKGYTNVVVYEGRLRSAFKEQLETRPKTPF